MDNWKVIGTVAVGVFVMGWLLDDDPRQTDLQASSAANVSSSTAANVDQANSPTPQPQASAPQEPRSPWLFREDTSPIDDSRNVYLSTSSLEGIPGRYRGSLARPTLYVRCVENTTALIVHMDGHFMVSSQYHSYGDVDLRIDDNQAFSKSMIESNDNKALGLWNGGTSIPLIRQLFGAEKLIVRATPHRESSMTMEFDISGLEEEIAPLREACHW